MIRPEPLPSEAWHHALASASIGSFALACPAPHRRAARRLARQLLEEAAAQGGGQVVSLPSAELLLGAAANAARRAARALAELLGEATATLHSFAGAGRGAARLGGGIAPLARIAGW
jgi:hypothetical protein